MNRLGKCSSETPAGYTHLDLVFVPLSHEIAVLSRQIELDYQDPGDRFLAATAVHLQLTLATVDIRLTQAAWLNTLS
jgi:PIN domain nuclease of toxin-antitoxin system